MIGRALAWLRANPALGLAAAGVGAVLVLPQLRSAAGGGEGGESAPAAVGPSPYMPVLAGSDLATADVANAIRDGNAVLINQQSQLQNALLEGARTQAAADQVRHTALIGALTRPRPGPTPAPAAPPAAPPPTPTPPVRTQPPPSRGPNRPAPRPTPSPGTPAPASRPRGPLDRARRTLRLRGSVPVAYTVKGGDTLSGIAARYGTPGGWPALYAANRAVVGTNPNLIRPGQRLTVTATRGV